MSKDAASETPQGESPAGRQSLLECEEDMERCTFLKGLEVAGPTLAATTASSLPSTRPGRIPTTSCRAAFTRARHRERLRADGSWRRRGSLLSVEPPTELHHQ